MNTLISLDEAWPELQGALEKVVRLADGGDGPTMNNDGGDFSNKEYMRYFTLVYNLCTQSPPHNSSEQLYQRALLFVRNHVDGVILPAVRAAADAGDAASLDSALVKLAERLKAYAVIVKWTKSLFSYLDRFHTNRRLGLPTLRDSCLAFIRQRLDSAATERQILEALAAAGTQNDMRGNPCRLCLAECRLLLVEALSCSVDLDEAPVPPKHALVELTRTARQARGADDAALADLRFGGAGGLLALGKTELDRARYTELVRAAHATQRRQRFAAMPRAATEGLYTQDGEREPTADLAALRAVARHRPRQLLLLGAMVSRGADSASPLVGAPIVLSADLASKIREKLHQLPGACPRAGSNSEPVAGEEFAWHPWAAAGGAAGGAAAAAAQGSGKRKREEESEQDQEEEEEESDGSLSDGFEYESD